MDKLVFNAKLTYFATEGNKPQYVELGWVRTPSSNLVVTQEVLDDLLWEGKMCQTRHEWRVSVTIGEKKNGMFPSKVVFEEKIPGSDKEKEPKLALPTTAPGTVSTKKARGKLPA